MQIVQKVCALLVIIIAIIPYAIDAKRKRHQRTIDTTMPRIAVQWVDDMQTYTLIDDHLDPYPFFHIFDKDFFNNHMLPQGTISYRYDPKKSVDARILKEQIDVLFDEIKAKKKKYTHFTALQSKDFNRRQGFGLQILKFNDYPFVVKIFIERPETFISPYHKGLEPIFFFYMGGGINRHLAGFTRLKNLEHIQKKISVHPTWANLISMPRKWYWCPTDTQWIKIVGDNMGPERKHFETIIPGIYCIIADAIEAQRTFSLLDSSENKMMILDLCNYLNLCLDPHLNNYLIEKETNKLVLVDTEHFASFAGLREPVYYDSYFSWYFHLAGKFLQNTFGSSKHERRYPKPIHHSMALA